MREADRPIEERVSVFDRPMTDADALPSDRPRSRMFDSQQIDPSTLRLAAATGDVRLYIARSYDGDSLAQIVLVHMGASASVGPRWALTKQGAKTGAISGSRSAHVTHGIVPDGVLAVRVGDVDAVLGENGFLAVGTELGDPITLMTSDGVRTVEFPPFPDLGNSVASTADGPGYSGYVEYAQNGITRLEIEDLDDPQWTSTLSTFVRLGDAPDVWAVGVVLLEGHRAGELAIADLVLLRDDEGEPAGVEFRGQTAFGPHPDPQRLDVALQRWREMRRRMGGRESAD